MDAASTAEPVKREIARIMALLSQGQPDRIGHLAIDDPQRGCRRLFGIKPQRRADPRQRSCGSGDIQRDPAPEEIAGIEVAEHGHSVRDGRLGAATAKAHRARPGTGAVRADLEQACLEPDDAAPAGADRAHVQRGHEIFVLAVTAGSAANGFAVGNGADIQRGAADVGSDNVAQPAHAVLGQAGRADQARHRAGTNGQHRHIARVIGIDQPACARHDLQRARVAMLFQIDFQRFKIEPHRRPDQRVDNRGNGPLVFANPRADFGRNAHEQIGRDLMHQFAQTPLVRIVGGGPQQRDGNRFHTLVDNAANRFARAVLIQGNDDVPVKRHALVDTLAQCSGHQRLRLGLLGDMGDIVGRHPFQPPARLHDEDRIDMTAARQQANLGGFVLDQGVRADGAAMIDLCIGQHLFKADAMHFGCCPQRSDEASLKIGRG